MRNPHNEPSGRRPVLGRLANPFHVQQTKGVVHICTYKNVPGKVFHVEHLCKSF